MESTMTYETAFQELKQLEAEIVNEDVTIDALAEKIKRATALIHFCQARLRATEDELNRAIDELDGGGKLGE